MKYVVCDIDGTLTKVGDRLKYIQESKNWDEFYAHCGEDKPNNPICVLIGILVDRHIGILLCSGRRESCREDTYKWLHKYDLDVSTALGLRANDDRREDAEVKPEILYRMMQDHGIVKDDILFILEDRASMVKKWRELGYPCLQVAEGAY